jgi:hypothetical protein
MRGIGILFLLPDVDDFATFSNISDRASPIRVRQTGIVTVIGGIPARYNDD